MSVDEPHWWWERKQPGEIVPLAFVKIDRAGSTSEWESLPEEAVTRRRARYTGSIEDLARHTGAAQPLRFQGDGVMLFFTDGDDGKTAPVRAFEAARALWERMTVDLSLPTRIAVHAARVAWHPDTGKLAHPAIDACGHLEHVAPAGSVAISERVFLALPAKVRDQIAALGVTVRDATPAWVYPASKAEQRDPAAFVEVDDLPLWTAFRAYALSADVTRLRYAGFQLQRREPPSLDVRDVFVPAELRPWRFPRRDETAGEALHAAAEEQAPPWDRLRDQMPPAISLAELFVEHRSVVVLGDPGAGKTTLLRWLAVVAAQGPEAVQRELGVDERLLPLLLSLGRLADLRREAGAGSVVAALARYFHDRDVGEASTLETFLEARLEAGSCLVLLDGLDEIRSEERAALRAWLESFCGRFKGNRFVVTSRILGYPGIVVPEAVEVVVRPWREEQVERYLRAFHRAYRAWETGTDDAHGAEQEAQRMLDALRRSPKLLALARNPFLASALALIHRAEGRLPRHRVAAYEVFARALCETWSHARRLVAGPANPEVLYEEEALPLLGHLALRMHEDYPSGTAPEEFVIETLVEALTEMHGATPETARRAARAFLDRAAERAQILYELGPGQWAFLHLTFQEFFAAAGLHAAERFEEVAMDHLFEPRWLETIRLGVGYYVLVQKRPRAALQFIERVRSARLEGGLAWVTEVLRKQIPLTALLVAEAGDAVPQSFQDEVARDFSSWRYFFPLDTWEPIGEELWPTDFGKVLARHVDDQHLCATYNDLIWSQLGYYGSDSIEEYLNPSQLEEYLDSDRMVDVELIPVLSKILLEREIPNWYAVGMLADIGGSEAIEILIEVVRREVNFDLEAMDHSALGAVALAALWRISEGL